MIIGLGYKKGSGKDTVADYLCEEYGFHKVAFATPLKRIAQDTFGLSHQQCYDPAHKEVLDMDWRMTPREIMQLLGQCFKPAFGDDIWVKVLTNFVKSEYDNDMDIVVTDMRFPYEAGGLKEMGAHIVKVHRPDLVSIDTHASEVAMDDFNGWDYTLQNTKDLEYLYRKVDIMLEKLAQKEDR